MSLVSSETRDGVMLITLQDPQRRNILSAPMCHALSEAVSRAAVDPSVKAIVVTGNGTCFCAGADLNDLEAGSRGQTTQLEAVYDAFMTVAMSPLPTLAAVNGPAVGAGMNLALACDMRIASQTAQFDTRFLKLGLHPGGGHAWMLLRAIGWANASRMLLGARPVDAEEALQIGLVQEIALTENLIPKSLAALYTSRNASRELIIRTKATLRLASHSDHATAFQHESREQKWSLGQPEFARAITRTRGM